MNNEFQSHTAVKGILSDQLNARNFVTVDAARELAAASGIVSQMRNIVAAPVQTVALEISNVDNTITSTFTDSVSSFLKTLAKFNKVVHNIATVRYAVLIRPIYSFRS